MGSASGWRRALPDGLVGTVLTGALLVAATTGTVGAQTNRGAAPPGRPAQAAPPPGWRLSLRDAFRVETWRFFDPPPGGGDPDYTFAGNRLLVQAQRVSPRFDVTLAVQHVGLANLPDGAIGPGALGTGPLYFVQGGGRVNPQRLYLRYANVRFKGGGVAVQAGRMAYASGAEAPSAVPKIEAVKRQRLDARLVGEFEWSLYQRGFDGVRADVVRPGWRLTGFAFMPTQGGFAREAEVTMTDVVVAGGVLSSVPSGTTSGTQVQGFFVYYDDRRPVTGRPDNTGRPAARADVSVATMGGTVLGAYPTRAGEADVLLWAAVQGGDWYGDDHGAAAIAIEGGHQWTAAPWRPWIRGGLFHASGDGDPTDTSHGTFFPILPTVRRFSQTTVYSTMNLRDVFVQALVRPAADLNIRIDLHRLSLASPADRWYAGSGATLARGGNFGYVSRPSNGAEHLGTAIEAAATWTIDPRWTAHAFVGRMTGGDVVAGSFRGDRLWFVYVETAVKLDWLQR